MVGTIEEAIEKAKTRNQLGGLNGDTNVKSEIVSAERRLFTALCRRSRCR